jgi:DNA-binding MarR family transcriptional regulator
MTQNADSTTVIAPPGGSPERLRLVVTRLARRLRQQVDTSISPTQQSALATVERRGSLTVGELAAIERVQPPTITAAVTRLTDQGLVARRSDPHDGRVVRVEITAAGRRLLQRIRSRKNAYLERRLRTLSPEEIETLDAAAGILERVLEEDPKSR